MHSHIPIPTPAYVPWEQTSALSLDDSRKSALCLLRAKAVDTLDTQLTACLVLLPQGRVAYLNRVVTRGKLTFELSLPDHTPAEELAQDWDSIRIAHTLFVMKKAEELGSTLMQGTNRAELKELTATLLDNDELATQWRVWAKNPELEPLVSAVLPSPTVLHAQSRASAVLAAAALANLGAEQSSFVKRLLSACAAGKLTFVDEEVPPAAAVGFAQVLDLVCEALPEGAQDLKRAMKPGPFHSCTTRMLSAILKRMPEGYWSFMQRAVDAFFQSNPSLAERKALAGADFDYAGPLPVRYPLALAAGRLLESCAETLHDEVLDFR